MRVVLAAVDLGATAQPVLGSAIALARRAGAEVHVLHVMEAASPADAQAADALHRVLDQERAQLEGIVHRCCPGAPIAAHEVLVGKPADLILARARSVSADVIVLGAHAGGDLGARVFGTTAERVVHGASVPCLVVRHTLPCALTRVAVSTDLSAESVAAARVAAQWLRELRDPSAPAQLHLLHVALPAGRSADADVEQETLRPLLRVIEQQIAGAGVDAIESHVLWASRPAHAIVDWTRDHDTDVVVVGTTNRGRLRERLLGSVATWLAQHSTCAVLLVPPAAAPLHQPKREPQLNCVMAGIDFSRASLTAAEWVHTAFAPNARQLLVHVVDRGEVAQHGTGPQRPHAVDEAQSDASARLALLFPETWRAERRTAAGRPSDELVRVAHDAGADMICIGAHTQPHGLWGLLGTTAEQLIRGGEVPVLVVRGRLESRPQRIMASIDNSRSCEPVLRWAHALAQRFGAQLHVVHVVSKLYLGAAQLMSGITAARKLEQAFATQAEAWMQDQLTAAGIDPATCTLTVVAGTATYEILALQQQLDTDLIVIGSRGAGAIGNALVGSVASAITRGASCPVLVVRAPHG